MTSHQTPFDARLSEAKQAHRALGPSDAQIERMLRAIEPSPPTPPATAPLVGKLVKLTLVVLGVIAAGAAVTWREPAPLPPASADFGVVVSAPAVPEEEPSPSAHAAQEAPPVEDERITLTERAHVPAKHAARDRPPDPVGELALLQRARRVVLRDPKRALALAQQHARDYPRGVFVEERELLAVQALLAARRRPEAERRAQKFEQTHAHSVHAHRMHVLLESDD